MDDREQGSANYGPWAECRLLLVFVNKVVSEHSHTCAHCCQWLLFPATAERSGWVRVPGPPQPGGFIVRPFRGRGAHFWSRGGAAARSDSLH